LSASNSCLYGLCQAAIISLGYSTGLGFIHTGKMLSFVYDIADLYKLQTTIPAAFKTVAVSNYADMEKEARIRCRELLKEEKVLKRIADDIAYIFEMQENEEDINKILVGDLWDDDESIVKGGKNYAEL